MKPYRTYFHAVLGLLLTVQGLAASTAGATFTQAESPAAATASAPCHEADAIDAAAPSCCDAACPDMATCAAASLALATSAPAPSPASADRFRVVRGEASLPAPRASFLLKPPIALHG